MIKRVLSFAKINLFLYVTSKRDDGFHNLYSLMTQIDLHDDILMDFEADGISVACDYPGVPEDESNLAWKAAALFLEKMAPGKASGKKGVSINIVKRIPPGGGLGGGSSNAAAVLTSLNEYHGGVFSKAELMDMGLGLGADVPFFIFGSPAIAEGVGEKLQKVENLESCSLVLCDPGVASSTAQVYKNIDFRLTSNRNYTKNNGLIVPLRGQKFDIREGLHNDLEEPACRLYPEIRETKEEMASLLQRKVFMSGSGSSLFALFSAPGEAQKGYEKLMRTWAGTRKRVFLSSF